MSAITIYDYIKSVHFDIRFKYQYRMEAHNSTVNRFPIIVQIFSLWYGQQPITKIDNQPIRRIESRSLH